MKIYGYESELNPGDIEPSELAEITLVANADELRKIAKFIEAAAEGIEKRGKKHAVEPNHPRFLIDFVLVRAAPGDLDDRVADTRSGRADFDI